MNHGLKPGDRVVKNRANWIPSEFDAWGAGDGVGVVVANVHGREIAGEVDVRWPTGRAMQRPEELIRLGRG